MPVVDISDASVASPKGSFFSAAATRMLFFFLLIGDIAWLAWVVIKAAICLALFLVTWGHVSLFKRGLQSSWISFKRAGVCGISLVVALFSPALGIMIACTYFLMYDKAGIQEVVPGSLQEQFQEFVKESN